MQDPSELFSLKGKTALITGASAGIGARLARVLASAGARTAVVARREEELARLTAQLPGSHAVPADLA